MLFRKRKIKNKKTALLTKAHIHENINKRMSTKKQGWLYVENFFNEGALCAEKLTEEMVTPFSRKENTIHYSLVGLKKFNKSLNLIVKKVNIETFKWFELKGKVKNKFYFMVEMFLGA